MLQTIIDHRASPFTLPMFRHHHDLTPQFSRSADLLLGPRTLLDTRKTFPDLGSSRLT